MSEYVRQNEEAEETRNQFKNFQYDINFLNATIGSLSVFPIIYMGGYLAFLGRLTAGSVVALINLMNYVLEPVISIVHIWNGIKQVQPIKLEIFNKKLQKKDDEKTLNTERYSTSLKNIWYCYPGLNKTFLSNFSFTFEEGKKYLITRVSGSGKSTLAKILTKMIIPEKGTIYIGKKNYEHLSFKNLNQIIRYTEQTPYLFKGDIFDNMIFYRNNIKSNDVSNILKYFHLEDIKDNNDISRNTISGGEKQRVVLTRAIMQLAPIYIFDEPTRFSILNLLNFVNSSDLDLITFLSSFSSTRRLFIRMTLASVLSSS